MIKPKISSDKDLARVLKGDGVKNVSIGPYENKAWASLDQIKKEMGDSSWGVRLVRNERFGGVLICQKPGEGNRLHYHPDADECWVILQGEWEWYIEGVGIQRVKKDDIVLVRKGLKHWIKCIGEKPGIRFAITKPDVDHVYIQDEKDA